MRLALALALLAPLLAGCAVYKEPGPTSVEGQVEGYTPMPSALVLSVKEAADERVDLRFDRREWHVAALAKAVDERRVQTVAVEGMERNIPGQVDAEAFLSPQELNDLRFDPSMSAQEREIYDREYDELLAKFGIVPPTSPAPAAPTVELPPLDPPR